MEHGAEKNNGGLEVPELTGRLNKLHLAGSRLALTSSRVGARCNRKGANPSAGMYGCKSKVKQGKGVMRQE